MYSFCFKSLVKCAFVLGVSYITANLYCVSACFMCSLADAVQICGNIQSTQYIRIINHPTYTTVQINERVIVVFNTICPDVFQLHEMYSVCFKIYRRVLCHLA